MIGARVAGERLLLTIVRLFLPGSVQGTYHIGLLIVVDCCGLRNSAPVCRLSSNSIAKNKQL